jgi:hypothetical protein
MLPGSLQFVKNADSQLQFYQNLLIVGCVVLYGGLSWSLAIALKKKHRAPNRRNKKQDNQR